MPEMPKRTGRTERTGRYAVIISACNEQDCIGEVLAELQRALDPVVFFLVVGVNGSQDATLECAHAAGALAAETDLRGYGHGCMAAIAQVTQVAQEPCDGFLFAAGDGATDPADLPRLVERHRQGIQLVLGDRTGRWENWREMGLWRSLANRIFGAWCFLLTGRFFRDIGPVRLIDRQLYTQMQMRESTLGWTIEPQILAARLRASSCEISVRERPRLGGTQKISGGGIMRSLQIAGKIMAAGWRARWREL